MQILLVESNPRAGNALVELLESNGYRPIWHRLGTTALTAHSEVDAVLLNLDLPDIDGLDVLRRLRRETSVPVLVLGQGSDGGLVLRVFRAGADDYLVLPIDKGELVVRIEAALRHGKGTDSPASIRTVVEIMDLAVDFSARAAFVAGVSVELTAKEFDLLALLARQPGQAVSRGAIIDAVWGFHTDEAVSACLNVHMNMLRAKLQRPYLIHTLYGFGYRLGPPAAPADGDPPGARPARTPRRSPAPRRRGRSVAVATSNVNQRARHGISCVGLGPSRRLRR